MAKETAEFAYDLHVGLSALKVPEFDQIQIIGMASTLAIHIKGLGEIDYEILRKVSDHYMGIPSIALKAVIELLADIEFVRILSIGKNIQKIIPNIPVFDDVYEGIGQYADTELSLNSHEQATLAILADLYKSPRNKDSLFNTLGIDKNVFNRCLVLGQESGILSQYKARGKDIIVSPYYFADNLDGLADVVASAGTPALANILTKVKENQGWPLSLIIAQEEIGGTKLTNTEVQLIEKLASEGIVKPPTIKFGMKTESFLFTPKPGGTRLNAANREIYERAMALISAVRKGQLLPDEYRIRSPVRILESLREKGYLRSNSEAGEQYKNLVVMRVAYMTPGAHGFQLHLNRTAENEEAIKLAINLLRTGTLSGMEVDQEARIALAKDEEYIQSLISSTKLKKRPKQVLNKQAEFEFEQMMMKIG